MAQYNRPPKAKAARPDDFISFFDHLTRYFMKHQVKLYVLIGAALLAFGGYTFYRYLAGKKMGTLAVDYWKADESAPEASLGAWQSLAKLKPPSPLSEVVDLRLGAALAQSKEWTQAAAPLQASAQKHSFGLWPVSQLALADSLENSGDFTKALEAYRPIAERSEDPFRFRAKLGMARSYLGQGDKGEAEKILYSLLMKDSEAPEPIQSAAWTQLAAMRVATPGTESAPSASATP